MLDQSPYQPPRGAIAPMAPLRYGAVKLFSARGRLGRVRYIGYSVGLGLLLNLLMAGWGAIVAALTGSEGNEGLALGGLLALALPVIILTTLLGIQRLHDFNASGWWSILIFVPLANLILYLLLLIMPGTQGVNRFGDPPPPNTTGVILLALILPLLMVIGILAAIAIPAYQDYVERARTVERSSAAPSQ